MVKSETDTTVGVFREDRQELEELKDVYGKKYDVPRMSVAQVIHYMLKELKENQEA